MGRPERPLDPDAGPVQRFAYELRQLREAMGKPSYRELSKSAHYSVTALSEAAGGEVLPSLAVALAYVEACGGDRRSWEARWRAAAAALADEAPAEDAPYLGLVTFGPDDAERFFGRRKLIDELCVRLSERSLLAVFGASGSGKSSLLRAGLVPALRADAIAGSREWLTILFTPGENPVEELAAQLATLTGISAGSLYADLTAAPERVRPALRQVLADKPGMTRVAILVDQFEEVFTLCDDEHLRSCFVDCLLAAADGMSGRVRVVLGVRADFYARCAAYPAFVDALRDRQLLIGPMKDDDLRSVITGPAGGAGLRVETALVEAILGDARDEPGSLPLVSHALLETWRRRKNGTLTLAGYRDAGGIRGAIAQTADQVYDRLDPEERRIVKNVFLRLTALGEGTEDTRRYVRRAELLTGPDGAAVAAVLSKLTEARLVTLDENGVQVAHEAIIRSWPRLRGWLAEDRELVRAHRHLTNAAVEWDHHGRDEELLYRGTRLAAWKDRPSDRLNDLERAFLDAGRSRTARERASGRRRVRLALTGLVSAVALVSTLAVVALVQARQAQTERDFALSRQLAASARSQLQLDPQLALLLARRAFQVKPTDEADAVLRQATADSRVRAVVSGHNGKVCGAAFSPDGRHLATSGEDGTVRVWASSGQTVTTKAPEILRGHRGEAWSPVFSPDGRRVAAAGIDGTVRVWDWAGVQEPVVLRGHKAEVWNVAFSPDGRRLASASDDETVRVWDSMGDADPIVLRGQDRMIGVSFSPDGRRLAAGGADGTIRIWNWRGRSAPVVLHGHEDTIEGVAFSPDGRLLASASTDGTIRVWDTADSGTPVILRGHDGTVEGVAFSPDGRRLASTGNDGIIRIWSAAGTVDPLMLRGHRGTVWTAAFSPDGRTLATAGDDGTARLWDVTGTGRPTVLRGHDGPAWDGAFSPDGRRVASAGQDGTVRVWNTDGHGSSLVLRGHRGEVMGVAISPDGRRVTGTGKDGTVRIWNTAEGGSPVVLGGHQGVVWNAAFSPDGRRLVSGGNDGTVRIWNTTGNGDPIVLPGHRGPVRNVAFSPAGRHVASAGGDGTVRVWDINATGDPVVLRGHQGLVFSVAFSPDGRRLVSGGNDGTVRIWNTTGKGHHIVLRGHQGLVWSAAFSPTGQHVSTSGNDNTVRIWNTTGRSEPVVFRGYGASVESVEFAPDGRRLITTHGDGTARVGQCDVCGPIQQVLDLAIQRTTRELTTEEQRIYLQHAAPRD